MSAKATAPPRHLARTIERLVGAEVQDGEWSLVLLFCANLFLLLAAYYILKVIREPLILLAGGAVRRSYARGLQAGLLVALIPAYSALANRIEPARLVNWIMGLFLASLVGFFAAGRLGLPIGFPFFVWLGVFSTLSIAQFWSLANDHLTAEEGRRLFPLLAVGGSIGGILGAQFAARGIEWLTPEQMMLVAAGILAACMGLTHAGHHAGRGLRARAAARPARERDLRGGFTLVLQDRYLLLIGLSVVVVNLITTTGDFILAQMVSGKAHALPPADRSHYISAFYGDLQTWITILSALVQILIVARTFKKVGVGGALLFMPLLVVAGYGLFAALPLLATAAAVKVGEGTTDYSLQNTVEQALFLPTSVDAKYKAKSAIDTVSKRLGDLGSTALVSVGTYAGFQVLGFAIANVVAGVVWVWLVVHLRRQMTVAAGEAAPATPAAVPAASNRPPRAAALLAGVVFTAALLTATAALGRSVPLRWFADRPVAWNEHDDANVAKSPETNHLQDEAVTVTIRDSLANEADRILAAEGAVPAEDVNAADEVPCSTWFCARNHLHPMGLEEIAAGPPAPTPVPPLKIVKGKDEGAATGFQVVDAKGKKFMLKLDPRGHLGLTTAAEMVGERLFSAAGYNVPGAQLVEIDRAQLTLAPTATFKLYGVEKRPLTAARVESQLAGVARLPDGRLRGVAVPWIGGQILGSYDTIGRRAGDPNDRIPHEHRRSLRASWVLFAWLSVLDPGPINTIDTVVEESGRHFVRHYMIDFSCAFGSATSYLQGPQQDGEYLVEIGRTLRALFSFGFYQRPFQDADARNEYKSLSTRYPSIGFFPAESFDPDTYRPNRRVPPHMRMTARDAYWGAKIVSAFSDAQLHAVIATARLPEPDEAYVEHALRVRRDIIGRRYLRAVAAVENPVVSRDGQEVCFDDLAIDRGYVGAMDATYLVDVTDGDGAPLASFEQPARGPRACVGIGDADPGIGYRVVHVRERLAEPEAGSATTTGKAALVHLRWRDREHRFVVVGLEREE